MRVAFLGSFGFGNLGDELCLYQSFLKYSADENFIFSNDPLWTYRSLPWNKSVQFFNAREELLAIAPDRIVFGGGGVGFLPSIRDAFHWMADHLSHKCELVINNIGVANIDASWIDDRIRPVFDKLQVYSVRDQESFEIAKSWSVGRIPDITYYPEIKEAPAPYSIGVESTRLIGLSLTGQKDMMAAILRNKSYFNNILNDQYRDHSIIPIISTWQPGNIEENDNQAFEWFVKEFKLESRVLNRFSSFESWRSNYTVSRLRADIASCECVVTQRKHNMVHAIGTGTKFIAVAPTDDDSLERVWHAAKNKISKGSLVYRLP